MTTVETAAAKYRAAKKAITMQDGEPSTALRGRLANAEMVLLEAVSTLIGKAVTARQRGGISPA